MLILNRTKKPATLTKETAEALQKEAIDQKNELNEPVDPNPVFDLEYFKDQFESGAVVEFYSSVKKKWIVAKNPTWKAGTKYRVTKPYKLVEKEKMVLMDDNDETYYIIIRKGQDGKLNPAAFPHVHNDLDDAYKQCEKLAKKHPSFEFVVFGAVWSCKLIKETVKEF